MELKILKDNEENDVDPDEDDPDDVKVVMNDEERDGLVKNVEIPTILNIALCNLNMAKYRPGISYCDKVIELV